VILNTLNKKWGSMTSTGSPSASLVCISELSAVVNTLPNPIVISLASTQLPLYLYLSAPVYVFINLLACTMGLFVV